MVTSGSGFSTRGKTPGTRGSWLVCCCGDIYFTYRFLVCFCDCCLHTLLHCSLQITMPPKRRRQIAASLNYRKRKDREEMRVEGESTSGDARRRLRASRRVVRRALRASRRVVRLGLRASRRVVRRGLRASRRVVRRAFRANRRVVRQGLRASRRVVRRGLWDSSQLVMTVKNKTRQ